MLSISNCWHHLLTYLLRGTQYIHRLLMFMILHRLMMNLFNLHSTDLGWQTWDDLLTKFYYHL